MDIQPVQGVRPVVWAVVPAPALSAHRRAVLVLQRNVRDLSGAVVLVGLVVGGPVLTVRFICLATDPPVPLWLA